LHAKTTHEQVDQLVEVKTNSSSTGRLHGIPCCMIQIITKFEFSEVGELLCKVLDSFITCQLAS